MSYPDRLIKFKHPTLKIIMLFMQLYQLKLLRIHYDYNYINDHHYVIIKLRYVPVSKRSFLQYRLLD